MNQESSDSGRGPAKGPSRRAHRKSRNGCRNCKRRKVKCDEGKPSCANCIRFCVPCHFGGAGAVVGANSNSPSPPLSSARQAGEPAGLHQRRGRGRPRRDWTKDPGSPEHTTSALSPGGASTDPLSHDHKLLNMGHVELLLQYTSTTAPTLAGVGAKEDDRMVKFWCHNVPKIGMAHPYVLHLVLALASYHLAFGRDVDSSKRRLREKQADRQLQAGLTRFTRGLSIPNNENCGSLYVSAALVVYCHFAAGPRGPGDLLVCNLTDNSHFWMPFIKGFRLIREMFEEEVLFSGLMAPLGPPDRPPTPSTQAQCARLDFPRADWEASLSDLKAFIKSRSPPDIDLYLGEFSTMEDIYRATFGDSNLVYEGPEHNRMVFGWLYRMDNEFVSALRRKEPVALLLLGYYALLLATMKEWYIAGWTEHLLNSIHGLLETPFKEWLRWPMEQMVLYLPQPETE